MKHKLAIFRCKAGIRKLARYDGVSIVYHSYARAIEIKFESKQRREDAKIQIHYRKV